MLINKRNISINDILPQIKLNKYSPLQDQNRINSINYEKSQIFFKDTINSLLNPKIDFFSAITVTKDEYEQTCKEALQLANEFDLKLYLDIISIPKLILVHKHMMDLFNYLITLEHIFEMNLFKMKYDPSILQSKMMKVEYDKLSRKQLNFYLNRLSNNSFDFPKFMPYSIGLNHLYKWVLCQIKLYTYYLNKKKLQKHKEQSRISSIGKDQTIYKYDNKNYSCNNTNLYNSNSASFEISDISTTRNNVNINVNSSNENSPRWMITNSPYKHNITSNIRDFIVHPIQRKYNKCSNTKEVATSFEDIMITKLGQTKRKENSSINLRKAILKECSLKLNGFNIMEDKLKKEALVMKSIPLLKNKTFEQLRKYYKMNNSHSHKTNKKHFVDIKQRHMTKDNKKLFSLFTNNRMELLESKSDKNIKELLE